MLQCPPGTGRPQFTPVAPASSSAAAGLKGYGLWSPPEWGNEPVLPSDGGGDLLAEAMRCNNLLNRQG